MSGDYFLFFLGIAYILIAVYQDLKRREVDNWLSFSLISFGLAYRAFYSIEIKDVNFFLLGLTGFGFFFLISMVLYYSRSFGGGDAKLLMGIGVILPFANYLDVLILGLSYIFLLLIVGAVYTLIYSIWLVIINWKEFRKEFNKLIKKYYLLLILITLIIVFSFSMLDSFISGLALGILIFFFLLLYIYIKSLDSCMTKLVSYKSLTPGDWLENDVKVGRNWIRKSVHGLSLKDIALLKKYGKKVEIKEGIPFLPAFLFSFMVFFYLILKYDLKSFLFALF